MIENQSEPIGVTATHPFWSADRQAFVEAGNLLLQERLKGIDGQEYRLTSIVPRAGPETVYNLEVAIDHVYYVGQNGLLAHNMCAKAADDAAKKIDDVEPDGAVAKSVRKKNEISEPLYGPFHRSDLPLLAVNNATSRKLWGTPPAKQEEAEAFIQKLRLGMAHCRREKWNRVLYYCKT